MSPPSDPWDHWRRRYGADFPAFFAEFEKEFARMQGMVDKIMQDAMRHAHGPQRHDPFVYGFTMRIGKDGVPQITPFGSASQNVQADNPSQPALTELPREPLTDVVEGDKEVAVTVELPGVEKGDVNLHVAEEHVAVRVDKGRLYHKQIQLPCKVVPSTAKATFKNGILDVTVQRASERRDPGHRVQID